MPEDRRPSQKPDFSDQRRALKDNLIHSFGWVSREDNPVYFIAGCGVSGWTNFDIVYALNGMQNKAFISERDKLGKEFKKDHAKKCGNHPVQIIYYELNSQSTRTPSEMARLIRDQLNSSTNYTDQIYTD